MTYIKPGMKQLALWIPEELHKEIKKSAIDYNISVKDWIIRSMVDQLKREKNYN